MVVDLGEVIDLGRREMRMGGEEAKPNGITRQTFVEDDQRFGVGGSYGADMSGRTVHKSHIGFPVSPIADRK